LDECVFEYPGTGPFSEVEAKAVADFLQATTSITFYVAVHSYGMVIIYTILLEIFRHF
jgi:Zinc carboxypeptidase